MTTAVTYEYRHEVGATGAHPPHPPRLRGRPRLPVVAEAPWLRCLQLILNPNNPDEREGQQAYVVYLHTSVMWLLQSINSILL